ncbi:MAG: restriction endonuclease [Xanthomonadaceae bacterium]|nr:restriction endonuclease [Xanthomonadaceae bacterium]
MNEPVAFYVKLKPQGSDAALFCRTLRRVFIGYPPWKSDAPLDAPIHQALHDITTSGHLTAERLDPGCHKRSYRASITGQQNVALHIGVGSIVLVPRTEHGLVYAARIEGPFTLFDPSAWENDYLALRTTQGLSAEYTDSHVGDVVQGWATSEWTALPFASLPRWIGQCFTRRQTLGLVHARDGHESPWLILDAFIKGEVRPVAYPMTDDPSEVARRLTDRLSPTSFEHLCVDLLRLERPNEYWYHCGGSGDGGADGIGYASDGTAVAVLQCKLRNPGGTIHDPRTRNDLGRERMELVMASLDVLDDGPANAVVWGPNDVAMLLLKHAGKLPIARTLSVASS